MNNVARWVQNANHTLKRSISSVTTPPPFSLSANSSASLNKNWIHPPDVLLYARVEYTVKFLGDVPVSQPKGTDVIKDAIKTLRFNLSIKRSQGFKIPRVELHINLDGVNIVDAKSKIVLYKYPLHRISFCADDKNDKRLFAFIAKQSADSNEHRCFVFLSDKLAEEITLTIGEAFDLAYRKFLENNGKDLELKKLVMVLRKRIGELEHENDELKQKLAQNQRAVSQNAHKVDSNRAHMEQPKNNGEHQKSINGEQHVKTNWENFYDSAPRPPMSPVPPPPLHLQPPPSVPTPRRLSDPSTTPSKMVTNMDLMMALSSNGPDVGKRLENLQLGHFEDIFDQDFDPRAGENRTVSEQVSAIDKLFFGADANKNGLKVENGAEPTAEELEQAILEVDSKMAEMREGFKRGISFGNDDFQMSDFDPVMQNQQATAS